MESPESLSFLGGTGRNRTGVQGFAVRCLNRLKTAEIRHFSSIFCRKSRKLRDVLTHIFAQESAQW